MLFPACDSHYWRTLQANTCEIFPLPSGQVIIPSHPMSLNVSKCPLVPAFLFSLLNLHLHISNMWKSNSIPQRNEKQAVKRASLALPHCLPHARLEHDFLCPPESSPLPPQPLPPYFLTGAVSSCTRTWASCGRSAFPLLPCLPCVEQGRQRGFLPAVFGMSTWWVMFS